MKRKLLISIICFILVCIGVILLGRRTKNPSTPFTVFTTPTPFPTLALKKDLSAPSIMTTNKSLNTIDISAISLDLPSSINLYQVISRTIPEQIIRSFLAKFPSLLAEKSQETSSSASWVSDDHTQQLVITQSQYLTYTNTYTPPKGLEYTIPSTDAAVALAKRTADDLGILASDFILGESTLTKMDGEHMVSVSDFSQANFISVVFNRSLNHTAVYAQGGNKDNLVIWIDKYGAIRKISFQYAFIGGYETIHTPSLLTIETRLKNGEGKIAHSSLENYVAQSISPITATLGYLDDRSTSIIQPIVIVQTRIVSNKGEEGDGVIYLPLFN